LRTVGHEDLEGSFVGFPQYHATSGSDGSCHRRQVTRAVW
jgi:hypothetical protein